MNHSKKSTLGLVFFTIFLDLLGVGILIPVIPQLLANPESPYFLLPGGWSYEQGLILLGYLTASFPLAQFFATPLLGQLSDKYGRKPVLAFSLVGTAISYLLFAYAIATKNIPLLFFSRIFDGITGGNIAVAMAVISDISAPEERTKNFGLIGAAFGLGFIMGPYLGGKLSDPSVLSWFNATTPFLLAALLSACNALSVWWYLKESNTNKNKELLLTWNKALTNIVQAVHLKGLQPLLSTSFFYQGGFSFFTTFAAVYLVSQFGATQGNIGDYFAYIGLWIVFTQGFVTRVLSRKFQEKTLLPWTILITALMIGLQGIVPPYSLHDLLPFLTLPLGHPFHWLLYGNMFLLIIIVPFFAMANGLTQANMSSLISKSADRSIQGEILGISSSIQALAQSIPAILSGYIAAGITPSSPILVSSGVIAFAWFIFLFFYIQKHKEVLPTTSHP